MQPIMQLKDKYNMTDAEITELMAEAVSNGN